MRSTVISYKHVWQKYCIACDIFLWPSRSFRSPRYIVTCTRIRVTKTSKGIMSKVQLSHRCNIFCQQHQLGHNKIHSFQTLANFLNGTKSQINQAFVNFIFYVKMLKLRYGIFLFFMSTPSSQSVVYATLMSGIYDKMYNFISLCVFLQVILYLTSNTSMAIPVYVTNWLD